MARQRTKKAEGSGKPRSASKRFLEMAGQSEVFDGRFHVSRHPLIAHKLTYMRQQRHDISSREYANLMREIAMMLAYEASQALSLREFTPEPPDGSPPGTSSRLLRPGYVLGKEQKPILVGLVRSGLVMLEGVRLVIPSPYIGHLGIYTEKEEAYEFMVTMPADASQRDVVIVDAFVHSGVTACAAIHLVHGYGIPPERIKYLTLIVSPQGYARINQHSVAGKASFYCARIDQISDNEEWGRDFRDMNERLFRTKRKGI